MKKVTNFIEIENACNSPYITTHEIQIILGGVSKSKADKFRFDLEKILDKEKAEAIINNDENIKNNLLAKCFYFNDTRPHRLPTVRVLQAAHLDINYIRNEANKMRKALKIERGD